MEMQKVKRSRLVEDKITGKINLVITNETEPVKKDRLIPIRRVRKQFVTKANKFGKRWLDHKYFEYTKTA